MAYNLNNAPDKPGVYIFKDRNEKPIYIGKASSLKKRLSSYLKPSSLKTSFLVGNIASCEWLLCDSELEALLLEANLIKKHKPKFNVCLKDDKAYPFIKITKEAFPRILTTRSLGKDGYYFGPYRPGNLRKIIKCAKELFKIRSCKTMPKDRSCCLLFHIGQCQGPCKGEINVKEYSNNVQEAISFLSGRESFLLKSLTKRMKEEASTLNFEEAARIRDKISAIESISENQKVFFTKPVDYDVIGSFKMTIFVLVIREGRLIGDHPFTFSYSSAKPTLRSLCSLRASTPVPPLKIPANPASFKRFNKELNTYENLIANFIKQFYLFTTNIPNEILIEEEIEDKALISSILSERHKKRVSIKIPKRGKKRELLLLAKKNASLFATRSSPDTRFLEFSGKISAIDISNISSDYATGSLVVFENGILNKDEYRRFKIQTKGPDDYGMIREVIERYFKRLIKENKAFPDILLIDGGRGQLNVGINTLKALGFDNVNVISITKNPDRIFLNDKKEPIKISSPSVFQYIRDEAHRFAISYHKKLRSCQLARSSVTQINSVIGYR